MKLEHSPPLRFALSIGAVTVACLTVISYSTGDKFLYGTALFTVVPFLGGFLAMFFWAPGGTRPLLESGGAVGALGVSVLGLVLLLGIEGMICIVMALPLAGLMAMLGAWLGRLAADSPHGTGSRMPMLAVAFVAMPGAVELESRLPREAPLFEARTHLDIAARPEAVWKASTTWSGPMKADHPIFRAGIAYPISAHIEGSGPGATRYCRFSTGDFVEPIFVWDPPRLLRFKVASNPPPMREWSPWGDIHPPHLDGFFLTREGELRLEPLANGGTRLIATTWYEHNLYPATYWRWWSDYILHRVHNVVLETIRSKAEGRQS